LRIVKRGGIVQEQRQDFPQLAADPVGVDGDYEAGPEVDGVVRKRPNPRPEVSLGLG
jgi:hypothetical protein